MTGIKYEQISQQLTILNLKEMQKNGELVISSDSNGRAVVVTVMNYHDKMSRLVDVERMYYKLKGDTIQRQKKDYNKGCLHSPTATKIITI